MVQFTEDKHDDDKNKFDTLSENDLKHIAVELRKISKGDEVEYIAKCTNQECRHSFEDVLNRPSRGKPRKNSNKIKRYTLHKRRTYKKKCSNSKKYISV